MIVTADQLFHASITNTLSDLQESCILLPSLRQLPELKELSKDELLLFIDIDSYGIAALSRFMKRHAPPPELTVIGLSDCNELNLVIKYLKSGIHGYFLKQEMNTELIVQIIMTLLRQGFPLSPGVTLTIIQTLIGQQDNYPAELSSREQQILNRLVKGSSYKLVANELNISLETVRYHIKRMYKKLDVNSKGEIIAKMLRNRKSPPPFMG